MTRRLIDIESLADFDAHIGKTRRLNGWFVQSVDLTERAGALLEVDPRGAVFLGCVFTGRRRSSPAHLGARCSRGCPICPLTLTEDAPTTRPSSTAPATTPQA